MKYNNRKATADGITFDSKKERDRYLQLKLLERAGEIKNLELQPKYLLTAGGKQILIKSKGYPNGRKAKYTPDFRYIDCMCGKEVLVVEEVKGFKTKDYVLRKAVFEAEYGIEVLET